jgi:hypothetical protein
VDEIILEQGNVEFEVELDEFVGNVTICDEFAF